MQGHFEKAEEYLLKAHQADKRDFWGIFDLLYMWLRNASSNRAKFDKMFDDYVNSPWHSNNNGLMASLHLVKGIQLCVLNDYDGAAEYFLGAFRNDASRTLQDLKVILTCAVLLDLNPFCSEGLLSGSIYLYWFLLRICRCEPKFTGWTS